MWKQRSLICWKHTHQKWPEPTLRPELIQWQFVSGTNSIFYHLMNTIKNAYKETIKNFWFVKQQGRDGRPTGRHINCNTAVGTTLSNRTVRVPENLQFDSATLWPSSTKLSGNGSKTNTSHSGWSRNSRRYIGIARQMITYISLIKTCAHRVLVLLNMIFLFNRATDLVGLHYWCRNWGSCIFQYKRRTW